MSRSIFRKKVRKHGFIDDLSALFFHIRKTLKCSYRERNGLLSLEFSTLRIDFLRKKKDVNICDWLLIRKVWDDTAEEKVACTSSYMEPRIYAERMREKMKSEPGGDWAYRAHLEGNTNRYLSNEMFLDNLLICETPRCTLEYSTSHLGMGLRTLERLRPHPNHSAPWNPFAQIRGDMARTAEWVLASQLGESAELWGEVLREAEAHIALPYKKRLEDVKPPYVCGGYIIDLCNIYSGRKTKIELAMKRSVPVSNDRSAIH